MKMKALYLGLIALPFAANADDFNYSYVEGGYVDSEIDLGPVEVGGDGFGLKGSFAINDTLHAFGEYQTQDFDMGVDSSTLGLGIGAHWPLKQDVDFVGELSLVDVEVESALASADDDGFGIGAGLRFRTGEKVELQAMMNYVDLEDSDTSLSLGGRYYLNDTFAIGGGLGINSDDTVWNIGVRADFGSRTRGSRVASARNR